MKFFVSAASEAGDDWIAEEIEVEGFEDALDGLRQMARRRWAGQCYRLTSVTEYPDVAQTGPLALRVILERSAG